VTRRAGEKTKTLHELAVELYRQIEGKSPLWAKDPPEGMVYQHGVAAQRQSYEDAVMMLRKADDHRQVIVKTKTRTVYQEPGSGRGDPMG
jgi:hypothetical protein